jgi:AraC-like DNA-binding protein
MHGADKGLISIYDTERDELIVAASMLEDGSRSADGVAGALDFPSGSAFRNTCQRYLGCTPHQIRLRGGAAWVITELLVNREKRKEHASNPDEQSDSAAA